MFYSGGTIRKIPAAQYLMLELPNLARVGPTKEGQDPPKRVSTTRLVIDHTTPNKPTPSWVASIY